MACEKEIIRNKAQLGEWLAHELRSYPKGLKAWYPLRVLF